MEGSAEKKALIELEEELNQPAAFPTQPGEECRKNATDKTRDEASGQRRQIGVGRKKTGRPPRETGGPAGMKSGEKTESI